MSSLRFFWSASRLSAAFDITLTDFPTVWVPSTQLVGNDHKQQKNKKTKVICKKRLKTPFPVLLNMLQVCELCSTQEHFYCVWCGCVSLSNSLVTINDLTIMLCLLFLQRVWVFHTRQGHRSVIAYSLDFYDCNYGCMNEWVMFYYCVLHIDYMPSPHVLIRHQTIIVQYQDQGAIWKQ